MELIIARGHLIVEIVGRNFMIDTGIPMSIGEGEVILEGEKQRLSGLQSGMPGDVMEKTSSFLGLELHGFIGMDLLSRFDILIDVPNKKIDFLKEYNPAKNIEMINLVPGIPYPVVEISIDGIKSKAVFDTGAKISYLNNLNILKGKKRKRNEKDYGFLIGNHETAIYNVPVMIGSKMIQIEFGILPENLINQMRGSGIDAFVGFTMIENNKICLSKRKNGLWFI